MSYYALEPEVAGGLGDGTVMDHSTVPPTVLRLEYELGYGWQGDELLETYPCFVISDRLYRTLVASGATGFRVDDVVVVEDEQLGELGESYGDLREFKWLKVEGRPEEDDLGIGSDGRLVVSQRALDALSSGIANDCGIEPLT